MIAGRFSRKLLLAVALGGAAIALPRSAHAHLGPPFPVITDQPIPGYKVTVLTNPDTTQAIAYVVLEPVIGVKGPVPAKVEVWIEPVDRHTARSTYPCAKEFSRESQRFVTQPNFDAVGRWYLGANLQFADGTSYRFITNVDATPPGIGRLGLVLFALPLVGFGLLFVAVLRRRKRLRRRPPRPVCVAQPRAVRSDSVLPDSNKRDDS